MKKLLCVLLSVLFLAACILPASAKSKQDLLDYLKAQLPAKYHSAHLVWAENVISQYDLSSAECDQLYDILVGLRAKFAADNGPSLDDYSASLQVESMKVLDQFCQITHSYYQIRPVANPKHEGDIEVLLYKADGTLVAILDGDVVMPDRTGEFTVPSAALIAAAAALLTLSAAFVLLRKRRAHMAA